MMEQSTSHDPPKSDWTSNHDDILRSWRKQCAISMWLALASKYYYSSMNNWLTYPGIIISAITSIGIVGLGCDGPGLYVLSILNLLGGILNTVCKQAQPAEKSQDFYLRAKDYYTLIREIDYLLAINTHDRPPVNEVMVRIKSDLDRIMDQQMQCPLKIIREYEQKFQPLHDGMYADLLGNVFDKTHHSTDRTPNDIDIDVNSPIPSVIFKPLKRRMNKPSMIIMPYQLYMNPNTLPPTPYGFNLNKQHTFANNRKSNDRKSIDVPNEPPQVQIDISDLDKHLLVDRLSPPSPSFTAATSPNPATLS